MRLLVESPRTPRGSDVKEAPTMSHTRAAFTVSGVVLAAIVVLSAFTGEHPTRFEKDRAALEAP